jgi:hypothetical protein
MGANAQTSVPVFTSGQVLTAQQQTEINTGIPVFATSVERDAAFGNTGEKILAEGQFAFLEDTDTTQYYDGSTWQAVGGASGLVLISTTTIGTSVSTVTVSNAFSATYENYKIILSGGVASGTAAVTMILGATTSSYYAGYNRVEYASGSSIPNNNNNAANWSAVGEATTDGLAGNIELQQPFATKRTNMQTSFGSSRSTGFGLAGGGYLNNATSYTGFTIGGPTLTGGTIKVYGYQNS